MQQQRRRPPVALSPVNSCSRSTRRSMPATPSQCSGCSQSMHNQFLSNVLGHLWHPECVRCAACRCLLNEQCYSREGKLYCKDDFIKKYIHRCFACQNLVQSHEFIRRIRPGRIYHAECFVCSKCKRTLQDEDVSALVKSDEASFNDLACLCQTCLSPEKLSEKSTGLTNGEKDDKIENEIPSQINGNTSSEEEKPSITNPDLPPLIDNHVKEEKEQQQPMEVDQAKPAVSPVKERPPTPPPPTKPTGRQSKVRQSTSSNGSKRSPTKSKATTPVSRQRQTATNERKGRSPATRSKSSATTPPASASVQTRSSNRRTTKSTRYRKRSFSSGSGEDETEDEEEDDDDDDDDMDFAEEKNHEQENNRSKPSTTSEEKKPEAEAMPTPTLPPPSTAANPSLLSQAKMSEPLSLLSGLAANPMSISSIMKPDLAASFMPPNFNPAFPTPPQFLPPGFPLQPRPPMPPPPPASSSSSQRSVAPLPDPFRSTHSGNASDSDSFDHSSSPSHMDVSTNVEPSTPAHPVPSPKPSSTTKPSALSSLLEFGTLPPSSIGDMRSSGASANPFPFPFVTPGPGVPFSPQAAAGMATFYRPPFGFQPTAMPLDMTQSNSSKKKSDKTENEEKSSQNLYEDSSSSSSPKKKARKSNSRSKSKSKKNGIDDENGLDEENTSSPPPPSTGGKRKKKLKTETTENGNTNDSDISKFSNGNANNPPHNLLAQMGLLNNAFMSSAGSANGKTPTSTAQQAQQAQLAAMYNMAPHFAAYNAFPGAFNPAFAAAAYGGGYPSPYGFHPAFGAPPHGQPFSFMPSAPSSTNASISDDKSSPNMASETRPVKSRSKSNTGGEKKKATTPRSNKKKAAVVAEGPTDLSAPSEGETVAPLSLEPASHVAHTPESISTPTKRRMSSTESEDFDDQHLSLGTNGKSGYDSDDSIDDADRSTNAIPSTSSTAPEKKGARTTIKPQQLEILCKAYDVCSKPNKAQREQLVAETDLTLRVIQVWFQNKRSKERKGKPSKDKDDDEPGDDSQSSPPPPTSEAASIPTES